MLRYTHGLRASVCLPPLARISEPIFQASESAGASRLFLKVSTVL